MFIAGPTAVGKSAVAFKLAQQLNGEIVSVDSMQVYRGMDIGTAKPSLADRHHVPHHLIDVVDVRDPFDAAEFMHRANAAAAEIQSRQRLPIFCGGTGLYFQAFLQGLGKAPPANEAVRTDLEQVPLPELLEELARLDPETFHTIDRANPRRVIRALEVVRLTGRPYSQQRAPWSKPTTSEQSLGKAGVVFFGLTRDRDDLRRRIDQRVDAMFAQGLVDEVEKLLALGLGENKTALQALGYRQVTDYLGGNLALEAAIALVKQKTRQYAKRQMTWFKHQAQLEWVQIAHTDSVQSVVNQLESRYLQQRAGANPQLPAT